MKLTKSKIRKILENIVLEKATVAKEPIKPEEKKEVEEKIAKLEPVKLKKTFASGKHILLEPAKTEINEKTQQFIDFTKRKDVSDIAFTVTIFAGTSKVPVRGEDTNEALAERRAKAAKEHLVKLFNDKNVEGVDFIEDATTHLEKGPEYPKGDAQASDDMYTKYQFIEIEMKVSGKLKTKRVAKDKETDSKKDARGKDTYLSISSDRHSSIFIKGVKIDRTLDKFKGKGKDPLPPRILPPDTYIKMYGKDFNKRRKKVLQVTKMTKSIIKDGYEFVRLAPAFKIKIDDHLDQDIEVKILRHRDPEKSSSLFEKSFKFDKENFKGRHITLKYIFDQSALEQDIAIDGQRRPFTVDENGEIQILDEPRSESNNPVEQTREAEKENAPPPAAKDKTSPKTPKEPKFSDPYGDSSVIRYTTEDGSEFELSIYRGAIKDGNEKRSNARVIVNGKDMYKVNAAYQDLYNISFEFINKNEFKMTAMHPTLKEQTKSIKLPEQKSDLKNLIRDYKRNPNEFGIGKGLEKLKFIRTASVDPDDGAFDINKIKENFRLTEKLLREIVRKNL